jgi:hypothetical protein
MDSLKNRTRGRSLRGISREGVATVIRAKWLGIGVNKVRQKDSVAKFGNIFLYRGVLYPLPLCTKFNELFACSEKPS